MANSFDIDEDLIILGIRIFRVSLKIDNGMSAVDDIQYAQCDLASCRLRDVCFIDDKEMILAISDECKIHATFH